MCSRDHERGGEGAGVDGAQYSDAGAAPDVLEEEEALEEEEEERRCVSLPSTRP